MITQLRQAVPARLRTYFTRHHWLWAMQFRTEMALRPRPVVVWSMPSTGSTTMQHTIEDATGEKALHIHNMSRPALAWRREIAVARGDDPRRRKEYIIAPWVARGLERASPGDPWRFVCLARNPVDRAVSHFFQLNQRALRALDPEELADPTDEQVADFADRFEKFPFLPTSIHWFDADFRPGTGIDIYAQPFPLNRGWQIYDGGRARSLVIRTEDLSRVGAPALAEFLCLDEPPVQARNSAGAKPYAALYQRFRQEAVISDRVLDGLLKSRYARHFYTDTEREDTYRRWSKG